MRGNSPVSRILVSLQFALSIAVLVGGIVFTLNADFQKKINVGFNKDEVSGTFIQGEKEYYAMEAACQNNPKIKAVAAAEGVIGTFYINAVTCREQDVSTYHISVGKGYFDVMDFTFLQGGPIDYSRKSHENAAVVNRAFLEKFGLLGDVLGEEIVVYDWKRKIIGVVENFIPEVASFTGDEPHVFIPAPKNRWRFLLVKSDPKDKAIVDKIIKDNYHKLYPSKAYERLSYEQYVTERSSNSNNYFQKIFFFLTILSGLLSGAGIFSLASINIRKRTKEIGIRKALGASVANVIRLVNGPFVKMLLMSCVLGTIIGYFGSDWLLEETFPIHMSVALWLVAVCALFVFVIGLSTTTLTILGAAKANPVDTLRDE